MKKIIRVGIPMAILLALLSVSGVFAQGRVFEPEGWQGPRPAPQQGSLTRRRNGLCPPASKCWRSPLNRNNPRNRLGNRAKSRRERNLNPGIPISW